MGEHVLVIGGTLLDTKGKPDAGLEPGTSNPGQISRARGGTARNVAENLARLGTNVLLITAVGNDTIGRQLLAQTAEAGGLDSIWVFDHLLFRHDPEVTQGIWECWTLLCALAGATA